MNLTTHMPSRDSRVWWFGIISAVIVALGANLDLFPWLPDKVQHGISLAAFAVGIISGKMAHSPGKSHAQHKRHVEMDRTAKQLSTRRGGR